VDYCKITDKKATRKYEDVRRVVDNERTVPARALAKYAATWAGDAEAIVLGERRRRKRSRQQNQPERQAGIPPNFTTDSTMEQ
jgi:hypothetical protein